jgi:N-acetyl-gamma-glutamyl-phosphate reductase
MKLRTAIIGATGYTAFETMKLLLRHPQAEITAVTSRSEEGKSLAEVHPSFAQRLELRLRPLEPESLARIADVAFSCLPHGASAETCRILCEAGLRVIDLSADFRLSKSPLYRRWYGEHHAWEEKLGHVPYGLPELFGTELRDASLVANPGCYPTSAILPLSPLVRAGVIETSDIIVDSKSGASGGGRTPKLGMLFCEVNESLAAYGVASHRHQPEMEDLIERWSSTAVQILFTPHLVPMDRGILSTIYVRRRNADAAGMLRILRDTYRGQPFVRIVDHLPATKYVTGTNFCDITARDAGDRVILISALDNLIKGAAGAAVQSMNTIFGVDQTLGLIA